MCTINLGPLREVMMHLAASSSVELVGYVIGYKAGHEGEIHASALIMARNMSKAAEKEFIAEPRDILVAHTVAENLGLDVVGVFHTHPSCPPVVSAKDREGMRNWPIVWIVASPRGLGAYMPGGSGGGIGEIRRCTIR
ncbi:M67 family metallopeptidase [Stetteria hydrogenophila]